MSLGDEFLVTLHSNVKGNDKNTPGQYETILATPLDLPGEWEVALFDITCPHSWINLKNEYHLAVLRIFRDDEKEQKQHILEDAKTNGFIIGMNDVESFIVRTNYIEPIQVQKFYVKNIITIVSGQSDIQSFVSLIQTEIRNVGFGLTWTSVEYNKERNRVSISNSTRLSILVSYKSTSFLVLLKFNQTIKNHRGSNIGNLVYPVRVEGKVEYIMLSVTKPVEADQAPLVTPIISIFVYTDFIEHVVVGNSQNPLLGYFPLQIIWRNIAYWNFNPDYYICAKEQNLAKLHLR